MSLYYLMSQLPSLDGLSDTAPLPITQERFDRLCEEHLGKRPLQALQSATLVPDREGGSQENRLLDAWNQGERQLRLTLGAYRAEKLKKPFDAPAQTVPQQLRQAARTAVQMEDPMEAERFLDRYRMDFLESLRPADPFCPDAVVYYGLKLRLLDRLRRFDREAGRQAYRGIYSSILRGAQEEAQE